MNITDSVTKTELKVFRVVLGKTHILNVLLVRPLGPRLKMLILKGFLNYTNLRSLECGSWTHP